MIAGQPGYLEDQRRAHQQRITMWALILPIKYLRQFAASRNIFVALIPNTMPANWRRYLMGRITVHIVMRC